VADFTPGPWIPERRGHNRYIWSMGKDGECEDLLAQVEYEKDFLPICAVPELLAALRGLLDMIAGTPLIDSHDAGMAFAAIAKATGK